MVMWNAADINDGVSVLIDQRRCEVVAAAASDKFVCMCVGQQWPRAAGQGTVISPGLPAAMVSMLHIALIKHQSMFSKLE